MAEDNSVDLIIKIVIAGDASVGKTNLLLRYCKDTFSEDSKATIGVDFYTKHIFADELSIKVQFWDTAGQEKYKSMSNTYFKMASGVIIVYDITRSKTFEKLQNTLSLIKSFAPEDTKYMLVGNKSDLRSERQVSVETATSFANSNDLFFWETSALTNESHCVFKAFDQLISQCIQSSKLAKANPEVIEMKKKYLDLIEDESMNSKQAKRCCM